MRVRQMGLALALAGVSAGPGLAQTEAWNRPTEPFHIAGNLYYVGTEGLASYLVTTPDGLILIDGALPASVPLIRANISKLGFKVSDIRILLNSHAHFDHSGGLAELKAETGAKLYAMQGDVSALEAGVYLGSETVKAMSAPPVKVDRVLQDGEKISLGGFELTANLTPGHTRGCTSWGMSLADQGKRYDALIFCSATVAANRITPPVQYEGIVADYRRTFARARTMHVDIPLAPHPEFFSELQKRDQAKANPEGPNPFIAPGEFAPFIARAEADFEATLKARSSPPAR